ncbi:MAG: DUF2255 family protein [Deltaproteobacteria bacterium]|nr:DUF2255 family protein [Deltaproteobacteria bacterium]
MSNQNPRIGGSQRGSPLALLLIVLLSVLELACQPKDETPGTWLRGRDASEDVSDWTFSEAVDEIFIETRPWYGIPHSTTIWCVSLDAKLYVGSYGGEKKWWEQSVAHDKRARLRIEGRLYDVELTPVSDPELVLALDLAYTKKYDMAEVFGEDIPPWRYYAVTLRSRQG